MTKNLNVTFKNIQGTDFIENGKKIVMNVYIAEHLFYTNLKIDKLHASALAIKLYSAKGEVEIEDKDVEIIKKVTTELPAGFYNQMMQILTQK